MRCVSSTHFFAAPADVFPVSTLIDIAPLGRHIRCVVSIYNAIIVFARLGRLICCANSTPFFVLLTPNFSTAFHCVAQTLLFFSRPLVATTFNAMSTSVFFPPPLCRHSQCVVSTHVFFGPPGRHNQCVVSTQVSPLQTYLNLSPRLDHTSTERKAVHTSRTTRAASRGSLIDDTALWNFG